MDHFAYRDGRLFAEELPVAEMIRVLEGPLALTDCAVGPSVCSHESACAVREPWQQINRVVERALESITLADLVRSNSAGLGATAATLQIDRSPDPSASPLER